MNDVPLDLSLFSPALDDTISTHVAALDSLIMFSWNDSDVDGDVTYTLSFYTDFLDQTYSTVYEDITDTAFTVHTLNIDFLLNFLSIQSAEFYWHVVAMDGVHSVQSDTLSFFATRFIVGIDRAKMRLYDCEQKAQEDVLDSGSKEDYNEEKTPKKS